jgi:RecB family exonuclease
VANLRKLLRLAREFEAREGRDLRRFADRLAGGRLGSARGGDAQLAQTDAVRLMTVHAAKGLEFPVVCFADLGHGPPIGLPLVLADGDRVGLRLARIDGRPRAEAFAYAELRAERDRAALAEERRIAYVAMTRARERLILSGAADFARWPAPGAAAPTVAWLAPALVADLPARLAGPLGVSELELGGAPLRLTLTPAGEVPAPPARSPSLPAPGPLEPPLGVRRRPLAPAPAQLALFGEFWPAPETGSPAAAGPAVPPPAAVSYSSLADHARCGYAYYLRRVLGLAEVPPPPGLAGEAGGDAAARGRIVHRLLERLDFRAPPPPPGAVAAELAGQVGEAEAGAIAELVGAFARSPLRPRLARAGSVVREASFALTVDGLLVGGYLDVLAREAGGELLVVDYKTDRVAPGEDLAARVAADYELQRRVYGLAALQTGAPNVEVAYCFLRRPEEVVAVRYGPADAARLEGDVAAAAAPLRAGRFEVAARPHRGLCATCPGRARLCSWEEVVTLGAGVHDD